RSRRAFHRAPTRAPGRPGGKPAPRVRSSFERGDLCDIGFRGPVLQILRKKWAEDVLPEVKSSVAPEFQSTERAAIADFLAMMPRSHHQKYFVVVRVFWLDCLVDRDRAI